MSSREESGDREKTVRKWVKGMLFWRRKKETDQFIDVASARSEDRPNIHQQTTDDSEVLNNGGLLGKNETSQWVPGGFWGGLFERGMEVGAGADWVRTRYHAMAEVDIASHYGLPSEFPEEWPAELDEEEGTDEESLQGDGGAGSRAHKSRYFALERSGSHRTLGSQKGGGTAASRDTLAQKDEPDPLGSGDSVLKILKKRGLSVDEESRVRNRFLLSSTSFSPALFLSQAHSNDSIQTLMDGLGSLSRSIDQKSASLKVLVEANFERFVRAKATIDSVYTEMRQQGQPQDDVPLAQIRRKSGHMRSRSSMSRGASPVPPAAMEENKKNALTKESEYGMKGIRGPLVEASVKAEEVWGPALGGREREQMLKSVVDSMERHREVYEIGSQLCRAIKQRDYEAVFEL